MEPLLAGSLANRHNWHLLSEGKLDEKLVSNSLAIKIRDPKKDDGRVAPFSFCVEFFPLHVTDTPECITLHSHSRMFFEKVLSGWINYWWYRF